MRHVLGNAGLVQSLGHKIPLQWQEFARTHAEKGGTPIWLASEDALLGVLILEDRIREDARDAIAALHRQGIDIVMCTGDFRRTGEAVARELGIDEVHCELLPEQKLNIIKELQQSGHKVGMVGDGVNDAPALARADTGFALGGGTDVAIEHADVTLVGDSLVNVNTAIEISSATLRNIRQNLFGAFVYNVLGIPLAAGVFYPLTGWLLSPMFASFAMAMSSVTVVSNANRLRFFEPGLSVQKVPDKTEIEKTMITTLKVSGMNCQHCVNSAREALEAVPGVTGAEVQLEPGRAIVEGHADIASLVAAIEGAGYQAAPTE